MILRAILTGAVLLLGWVAWRFTKNSNQKYTAIRVCLLSLLLIFGISVVYWLTPPTESSTVAVSPADSEIGRVPIRQVELPADGYVGSQACLDCHSAEHASWDASYHSKMTQVVTSDSVLGDFDDVTIRNDDGDAKLKRVEGRFFAEFDEPVLSRAAGRPVRVEREMVMSTGSHHMQLYWYPIAPDSRAVGLFPFAYLKADRRWVPRDAIFLQPPSVDMGHEVGRWNNVCIRCHATHGKPGIEIQVGESGMSFDAFDAKTSVVEFGISCEECHGPGERHVKEFAGKDNNSETSEALSLATYIVNPAKLSAARSVEVCGQCHGIFDYLGDEDRQRVSRHGETYRPGDKLEESRLVYRDRHHFENPAIRGPNKFLDHCWNDGMVRISGRDYNAVIRSPCFQGSELTCLTCHQLHRPSEDERPIDQWTDDQLKTGMRTNHACTQCHQQYEDTDALAKHTHHSIGSSGSNCYNCHMPFTTYGLLKAIRSHEIELPNVSVSMKTGRPNACNQCHLDQTLGWAAEHLRQWYELPPPRLSEDDHRIAASIQWLLKGDAGQRALMAWSFGWEDAKKASGTQWMAPYLAQLLEDPYDAVRYIAHRSLVRLPGFESFTDYDFVGAPEHWRSSRMDALETWRQRTIGEPKPFFKRTLITDDGEILGAKFESLLRQRDDRNVQLLE